MNDKAVVDSIRADVNVDNKARALEAARSGLDFMVRHQETSMVNANHGRFAFVYRCNEDKIDLQTTNWITGILVDSLLLGHQVFGDKSYLEAARRGVSYLRSLQDFNPRDSRFFGTFHEDMPQSNFFHPRDALTAAWALLDWSIMTGCQDAAYRARAYADWLICYGMDGGYPRWTVSFETFEADPRWYGSFHSGSAFFFARLYTVTKDRRYLETMCQILDLYNNLNLTAEGKVNVIVDIETRKPIPNAHTLPKLGWMVPEGWIRMHEYNDDFGALANLEAWRLTKNPAYLQAAESFLGHMLRIQHADGGFGPEGWAVPAAGGSVLLELLAARKLGTSLDVSDAIERAVQYVLGLQIVAPGKPSDGAFVGFTEKYTIDRNFGNARSAGYAVLSLLHYAGATEPIYFPDVK